MKLIEVAKGFRNGDVALQRPEVRMALSSAESGFAS
jgi:hypothetical protein